VWLRPTTKAAKCHTPGPKISETRPNTSEHMGLSVNGRGVDLGVPKFSHVFRSTVAAVFGFNLCIVVNTK